MNEEILKTMPEYIQNLPKDVRDLIFDGVWKERTMEVATKYSLDEQQTDILIDKVLFVLIGLDSLDDLQSSITSEMFISSFLAGQLVDELGERVFEYAADQIEKKRTPAPASVNVLKSQTESHTPEINPSPLSGTPFTKGRIKPNMTPMTETGETAHTTTPEEKKWFDGTPVKNINEKINQEVSKETVREINLKENVPSPTVPKASAPDNLPGATPVTEPEAKSAWSIPWPQKGQHAETTPEPVQKPTIGVPRYTASDVKANPAPTNETQNPAPTPVPQNPADAKLNTVVSTTPPESPKPKYSVDPYREPIE